MHVIKIGERYLNVDQVTEYTVEDNTVVVHFGPHHETRFTRHDAVLLRQWLERIAMDIAEDERPTPSPPSRDLPGIRPERRYESRR